MGSVGGLQVHSPVLRLLQLPVLLRQFQDRTKGSIQDFQFGLEYRLIRNIALGFAYNKFGMQLENKGDNATLNFDTTGMAGCYMERCIFSKTGS